MKGIITNKFYIFTFLSLLLSRVVYAIDCTTLAPDGGQANPSQIVCPLYRLINVLLIGGGILLAVLIGVGAIKLSTALGDPKGFEGGKKTWTFALFGFFVVIGSFALLLIIGRLITGNTEILNIPSLKVVFESGICALLRVFWITDPSCGV